MVFVHIHYRKEIENYLLAPSVVERAVRTALRSSGKTGIHVPATTDIEKMLDDITRPIRTEIAGQFVAKRCAFFRSSGADQATIAAKAVERFDRQWKRLETRLLIVPGKEVLKRLRERVQEEYGITLTTQRIITAFRKEEIPADLKGLLDRLESFRKQENRVTGVGR